MGAGASLSNNIQTRVRSLSNNIPMRVRSRTHSFSRPRGRSNAESSRMSMSSMNSTNSRSCNSVREMALIVRARQENAFLSQDEVKSELNKRVLKRRAESTADEMPMPKTAKRSYGISDIITGKSSNNRNKIYAMDESNNQTNEPQNKKNKKSPDLLNLSFLRIDTSTDNSTDQKVESFDSPQFPSNFPTLKRENSENSLNSSASGCIKVEGTEVEVNEEGIVRPSGSIRAGKLPMKERLVMLCKLGSGASSSVCKALDLHELKLVAVKIIHVNQTSKRQQMVSELSALYRMLRDFSRRDSAHVPAKFRRPEKYIVDFYDAFCNLGDNTVSFMLEYMDGGSLQDIVDMGGCEDESTLANIAVQALKGLNFLHGNDQLHRDLKPANFLISHAGEVKITDLGLVKKLDLTPGKEKRTNSFVGTSTYMSPERIDGKEYGFSSDIWAFGLSLISIALGKLPVDTTKGYWSILYSIRDAPPPHLPKTFSSEFRDFIDKCMCRNPEDRWDCQKLLRHPFLRKVTPDLHQANFIASEKGITELKEIINAAYIHVKQIQSDYLESDFGAMTDSNFSQRITNHKIFGDLKNSPPSKILANVLFQGSNLSPSSIVGGPEVEMKMDIKPKLRFLAKQLQLPVDLAVHEALGYLQILSSKE